jgi:hypothetical protein
MGENAAWHAPCGTNGAAASYVGFVQLPDRRLLAAAVFSPLASGATVSVKTFDTWREFAQDNSMTDGNSHDTGIEAYYGQVTPCLVDGTLTLRVTGYIETAEQFADQIWQCTTLDGTGTWSKIKTLASVNGSGFQRWFNVDWGKPPGVIYKLGDVFVTMGFRVEWLLQTITTRPHIWSATDMAGTWTLRHDTGAGTGSGGWQLTNTTAEARSPADGRRWWRFSSEQNILSGTFRGAGSSDGATWTTSNLGEGTSTSVVAAYVGSDPGYLYAVEHTYLDTDHRIRRASATPTERANWEDVQTLAAKVTSGGDYTRCHGVLWDRQIALAVNRWVWFPPSSGWVVGAVGRR